MIERFHTTDLTDDELALFDAMWDGDCAFWMLGAEYYQEMTALPYAHHLDDPVLEETLVSLADRDLVRAYLYVYAETEDKRYFGLTQKGGAYWELERKPDWTTYCYPSEYGSIWSVESPSLETAHAYAQWAYDAGWGAPPPDELVTVEKPMYRFLPWYDFPMIYELQGERQAKTYDLDWDDYQSRRTWWLDLSDWLDL